MKATTAYVFLVLSGLLAWGQAHAQYNLRTIPANPTAGMPFVAAFDSNECEVFLLTEPATPASVAVQGTTVHLEVDRISSLNCSAQPVSHTLNLPALPAGTYQLELFARSFQSPGSGMFAQSITFQVGLSTAGIFSIPTNDTFTLVLLAGLLVGLGYAIILQSK